MTFDIDTIKKLYKRYPKRVFAARQIAIRYLHFQKGALYSPLGQNIISRFKKRVDYNSFTESTF